MTTELPAKRHRGGQHGNKNAKKNRGNKTERRHRFARGNHMGGAPLGNQNARRKREPLHIALLNEFAHDPEAVAWIEANARALDESGLKDDNERDRALFFGYLGLTPELLAESGQEYVHGLYTLTEGDEEDSDADIAA
jgi:hypothetical protein